MKGRLARVEREQAERRAVTVVVVEDRDFYGNAHLLPPTAGDGDGQATGANTENTTSNPVGEEGSETA